ncbi:MAG: hypothetical protein M1828_005409 [Chrysothrix sp. TS-e1954]|nr:MAG: hypothetical protein M1828_005409 [Chrysothrix sp. TS-e1954]
MGESSTNHDNSNDTWRGLAQAASYQNRPTTLADPRLPAIASLISNVNETSPFSTASTILESGSGTAPILDTLLSDPKHAYNIPHDCRIVASDYSRAMLDQVKKTKGQKPQDSAWTRAETVLDDAQSMENFADGSITHALSSYTFFLVPDPTAAVKAHHRILAPNGILATASLYTKKVEWATLTGRVLARLHPELPTTVSVNAHATPEGVEKDFREAHFRDVRVWQVDVEMGFESREKWARFCTELLPNVRERLTGLDEAQKKTLREAIQEEVKEITQDEPGIMKGVAIIGMGRK